VDGDFAVVSAPGDDSGNNNPFDSSVPESGAVHVFRRDGNGWVFDAFLKQESPETFGYFGESVDIDGDTIVVGSPRSLGQVGLPDTGRVTVFRRSGGVWNVEATLHGSKGWSGFKFGWKVAIHGDVIAVTSIADQTNTSGVDPDAYHIYNGLGNGSGPIAGAVYVFRRTQGVWVEESFIKSASPFGGEGFGVGLALEGNWLVVGGGAPATTPPYGSLIYTFESTSNGWVARDAFTPTPTPRRGKSGLTVRLESGILATSTIEGTQTHTWTGSEWQSQGALPFTGLSFSDSDPGTIDFHDGMLVGLGTAEWHAVRLENGAWISAAHNRYPPTALWAASCVAIGDNDLLQGHPHDNGNAVGIDGTPTAGPAAPNSGAAVSWTFDPTLNWSWRPGCTSQPYFDEYPIHAPRVGTTSSILWADTDSWWWMEQVFAATFIGDIDVDGNGCGMIHANGHEQLLATSPTPYLLQVAWQYGVSSFSLTIPNDPALIGQRFALQTAFYTQTQLLELSAALEFEIKP
jgi:hypothetical protein